MVLKVISGLLGVAGLAWLALLFSSRAILVDERVVEHAFYKRLECSYFIGSGRMRKEYFYSESGTIGRAACPRWETVPAAQ